MTSRPNAPLLGDFAVVLHVPVAWGEMDAYAHVNNAVFFRWFESARIAYFDRIAFRDLAANGGIGPILHSTCCRFRRPILYPDTLQIGARITDLGEDRFTMEYALYSERLGEIAARGEGIVVAYDYERGVKARLPEAIRQRIEALEAQYASSR